MPIDVTSRQDYGALRREVPLLVPAPFAVWPQKERDVEPWGKDLLVGYPKFPTDRSASDHDAQLQAYEESKQFEMPEPWLKKALELHLQFIESKVLFIGVEAQDVALFKQAYRPLSLLLQQAYLQAAEISTGNLAQEEGFLKCSRCFGVWSCALKKHRRIASWHLCRNSVAYK